jgi:WD40 repeat protein
VPRRCKSLTGHQSAVECVTFDAAEEVVVAGAAGGTLKMWDLAAAKGARGMLWRAVQQALPADVHSRCG